MNVIKRQIKTGLELFRTDSLFRNAVYLMASTGIMSVLGFGFWIFVAHLYTPAQIGLASALISITLLIANLSFFGLNAGLVRFLPNSKDRSGDINAALVTVGVAAMIAATIYLIIGGNFRGSLAIFATNIWAQILFVVLMAMVSLNTLTDSIFITSRRAEFHTLAYTMFGLVKLVLPLFLIPLGSLGIFGAYVAAVVASLALSLYFMWRYCGYQPMSLPNWNFITKSRKYARNNYAAILLSGLPTQLMPSLIIGRLGSANAAYFAMALTMANLIYVIPSAITNSLLAESSHDISKQSKNVKRASQILAAILGPAVILSVVIAPYLLRLFGEEYANGGAAIFQIFAVSAVFIAANAVGNVIMNIEYRSGGIVVVQAANAATALGLALPLMRFGLVGVGVAIASGHIAGVIVQLILLRLRPRARTGKQVKLYRQTAPLPAVIHSFLASYHMESAQIEQEIIGGLGGSTVRVSQDGKLYILKMYHSSRKTMLELNEEYKFTQHLLSRGIPVPQVIRTAQGEIVARAMGGGVAWLGVLMVFESGAHPSTYSPALLRNMARTQARIHLGGLGYSGLIDDNAMAFKNRSFRSRLLGYAPKGLSHFDFDGSNILVEDDEIACVLDFEGMRYDPLVVCVLFTLIRLYDLMHDPSKLEIYLSAYQSIRRLNWLERGIISIALTLHYRSLRMLRLHY